ncbi:MAG: iron-sulfur cluster repair di-iron protein [Balneolales bacterium]|nr:iron-sulfur cluster repair di-iron protein [Balneolales bacterium]
MINPDQHIADIVTNDYRTAGVFKQYGIDFCCGGKIPLSEVCQKKGIDIDVLSGELQNLYETPSMNTDYTSWSINRLSDFIVGYHHGYIRDAIPRITSYANKVASRHGNTHPDLIEIYEEFQRLSAELMDHAEDEETRVFPALKNLSNGNRPDDTTLNAMIDELESEHTAAGESIARIRTLTSDFTPPEWACNTFRILFKELEAFETDLHHHVHLENNILFRKAQLAL